MKIDALKSLALLAESYSLALQAIQDSILDTIKSFTDAELGISPFERQLLDLRIAAPGDPGRRVAGTTAAPARRSPLRRASRPCRGSAGTPSAGENRSAPWR